MQCKNLILAGALALASLAGTSAHAAHELTLEQAKAVGNAAESEARRLNAGGSIAVVDAGGHVVYLVRIDNTFPAAGRVSIGKASTSATFRKPTAAFEETINKGRFTMTALPDFTPLQGGVPLMIDGHVVGGVGVSGTHSAQEDEVVAIAGAKALEAMPADMSRATPKGMGEGTVEVAQAAAGSATKSGASSAVPAGKPDPMERILLNVNKDGLAIQGYDPVAYFTLGKAAKGDPKFTSVYRRATYHFANAEHKKLFDADPEKYEPQYGGYCGYAASINRLSPIEPDFFGIENGRLILQHNQTALDLFNKEKEENIVKADNNWPLLEAKNGKAEGKTLILANGRGVGAHGYDIASYFKGTPLKGTKEQYTTYHGVAYYFATKANRFEFEDDPVRQLPVAGGYCAYAASQGQKAASDPGQYTLVDGRLCLFANKKAKALFDEKPGELLKQAQANYPALVQKYGK